MQFLHVTQNNQTNNNQRKHEVIYTKTGGSIPCGEYPAEFIGDEPFDGNPEFGEAVMLKFRVTEGEHEDFVVTRIVSKKFSSKAALTRFIEDISGEPASPGKQIDTATLVGIEGTIRVVDTPSGRSKVDRFDRGKNPF